MMLETIARLEYEVNCTVDLREFAIACRCESRSFQWHDTMSYYGTLTETSIGYAKASAHSRLVRLSSRDERLHKLAALPLALRRVCCPETPKPAHGHI
jgi:hypothetical protein